MKNAVKHLKQQGRTIGFVPTMGSLHEGHLSLVRRAKKENDAAVVSVFVNPLQFGPREDYVRYPRNLPRDARLLKREEADFLFVPERSSFYSAGFQTSVSVENLSRPLCGAARPRHFAGVATVVLKLLNLIAPDVLYLGRKDYQQCRVIEQMAEDLDVPVKIRRMPIVRERDGLAMSSRNAFLSDGERGEAAWIFRALKKGQKAVRSGVPDAGRVKKIMLETLAAARRARVDYAEIVDAATLRPVVELKNHPQILLALAVFFRSARLIDNLLMKV